MNIPEGDAMGHSDGNSASTTWGLIAQLKRYPPLPLEINNVPNHVYAAQKPHLLARVLVVGIDADGGEADRPEQAVKVRVYPIY